MLLLEPDLSTLALKQVEMSHLATFKPTEAVLRPKKNNENRVFGRILYLITRSLPVLNAFLSSYETSMACGTLWVGRVCAVCVQVVGQPRNLS